VVGLRAIVLTFMLFLLPVSLKVTYAEDGRLGDKQTIYSFLEESQSSQLKLLNEGAMTYERMLEFLSKFMTEDLSERFIAEHSVREEMKYKVYGTDFPIYFIPFLSYSDVQTKVIQEEDEITVYEYLEANEEGPVLWDDHYVVITLVQKNNRTFIIENIEYSVENPINIKNGLETDETKEERSEEITNNSTKQSLVKKSLVYALKNLIV
jgi:hypothetical protein